MTDTTIPKLPPEAFPPYVITSDDRERWELAHAISCKISADNEPDGRPNTRFVWYMTRHIYSSEIATGSADDEPAR